MAFQQPTFHQHQLANGLTLIGEVSPSASSVAVGFFVRTGSRDETAEVSGVSHFLEHMVFKGTQRRTHLDVNLEFDRIGASYNASTGEETTSFYAAILPEYLPQAVDLLADILRPALRPADFDMEKNVILEEIRMYDDQPYWCAYEEAKKTWFDGHPLANSVLGTRDSISALTCEQMRGYFGKRYLASNIVASIAGNFDWKQAVKLFEKHCGPWPEGKAPRRRPTHNGQSSMRIVPKPKVQQEYAFLMSPGPSADSSLRYAGDVLAMVLGDDSGSRLYWALVDPGLADAADVGLHEYDGAGTFWTVLTCDPKRTGRCLNLVRKVFGQVQGKGIGTDELDQAKNKILSRIVRSGERPLGRMRALGWYWLYQGRYRSVDDELASFEAVTVKKVGQVLEKFPIGNPAVVAYGPARKLPKPPPTRG